jgi:hypothetical protein
VEFGFIGKAAVIDLKKSYRLSRFGLALVICIMAVLVGVILRYFEEIQASVEQVAVDLSLLNMKQMVDTQNLITKTGGTECAVLDKQDVFFKGEQRAADVGTEVQPGDWQYDAQQHQLTYFVRSTHYFKSKFGQKIIIDLSCKEGRIFFKASSFQWCRDKAFWGCKDW